MTDQPEPRHTADTITDNDLDELYARIATLEAVAASNKRHVQLIVPDLEHALARAEQAEAALARVRAWAASDPVPARSKFGAGYREATADALAALNPQE